MKVIIIGGGAAGMLAAYQAAKCGNDVSLYEKNEKLGKKIFITGKGRCNVTNACEVEELLLVSHKSHQEKTDLANQYVISLTTNYKSENK